MLNRDAARRALPRILERLGTENRKSVQTIAERLNEDGRANLGEVLRLLYPQLDDQRAQAKLRQLRRAIAVAAEKPPAIEFQLDGDTQTRSQPDDRFVWFEGVDPLAEHQAASVGEPLANWVEIEAERLGPVHCHLLYAEKDKKDAAEFADLLRPHLAIEAIDLWTRSDILPGQNPKEEERRSESACIMALALISPEFRANETLQDACQRLGGRLIPVSLYQALEPEYDTKVFRHQGKSFGDVRNKKAWVSALVDDLRSIRERRGHVRVPLPELEKDFVPGEAHPFSFARHAGGGRPAEVPTNERLREATGSSAIDQLLAWAADEKGSPYCALLGELGMGKTTTVKELTRRIKNRVPLYFDLRNVRELARQASDCPGLRTILASLLEKQSWMGGPGVRPPTVDDVIRLAAQGALVIFDGLDEVLVGISPARGQLFTRQIFSLIPARKDTKGRMLVTCRSHFFRTLAEQSAHFTTEGRDAVTEASFTAFVLLPFREEQIREYLNLSLGPVEGARAYELISTVHNLPELAERPYTLTLIRRQFHRLEQEKAAGRPITGLTLYRYFIEEWLLRDQGKHYIRPDDKQLLMEELAAELARQGQRSWTARQLELWRQTLPERHPALAAVVASGAMEAELLVDQDLRNATFLVRAGDDTFRFAHSSLQEYFLACYLRRALEEGRPDNWALATGVSRETLEFLGQSLLESPSDRAQAGLRKLRDQYRKHASELALRFFVLAFAKGYPCPAAVRFQLPGANLWEFEADFGNTGDRFDLSDACLDGARLANSYWRGCRLTGCTFVGADAARSEWHRCDLRDTVWTEANCTALFGRHCDLRDTDFSGAIQNKIRWVLCKGLKPRPAIFPIELVPHTGHEYLVSSVSWSPDGCQIASGSYDGTLKLWDAESGDCLRTFLGHSSWVRGVAWSPDGLRVASGSFDATVKVWDARSAGACLLTLTGHPSGVLSVAWSPDGRRLASGSYGGTIQLWDAESGQCLCTWSGHGIGVLSVAWSPDGRHIASGSYNGTVKLWDTRYKTCLRTLSGHKERVSSVAWSSDRRSLASCSADQTVKLWDAESGECLRTLSGHTGEVSSVAWSPDGLRLASSSEDRTTKLWDAESGSCLRTLSNGPFYANCVAWSPDGGRLASGSLDTKIKLWDVESGDRLHTFSGQRNAVSGLAWSLDGCCLAAGSEDNTVKLWETKTGDCARTLWGHASSVQGVAWSPNSRRLASGSSDGSVKLWDTESGDCLGTLLGHGSWVRSVAWNPGGHILASGSDDQTVKLWDVESGNCLNTLAGHERWILSVTWSPNGRHLASASTDETVKLWDAESGDCIHTLLGHRDWVSSVAWSPDGAVLASGGDDKTVKLWNVETGNCLQNLSGHGRSVASVAWSPDGRILASGSDDMTVKLWDVETGNCLHTLSGPGHCVSAVSWSPDGSRLAASTRGGAIMVYDTATFEEIQPRRYQIRDPRGEGGRGAWAVVDVPNNLILSCSPGAWRFFRWRVPGETALLPAEAFGPLPERGEGQP
jgi:WD40 repeat protein